MRKAGLLVWEAHRLAAETVRPGVTTAEIDAAVEQLFADEGATSLFKNYRPHRSHPPFPSVTCISINEEVVHGIPGSRQLVDGDVVSIDIGCKVDGWCGDAAMTHGVGAISTELQQLLEVTKGCLDLAIEVIDRRIGECIEQAGRRKAGFRGRQKSRWPQWKEVARQMERHVKKHGFSVVESFVGHGIGRQMHEDPQVPNFVGDLIRQGGDFSVKPGLVIAVEPMVNLGTEKVCGLPDRWTQVTADGLPSAHFEHTIAVTETGAYVLTAAPGIEKNCPA